jgi:hypothetical protein
MFATTVFHCRAAMAGPWPAHESAPVAGTRNIVTACLDHGTPKLVYVRHAHDAPESQVADNR